MMLTMRSSDHDEVAILPACGCQDTGLSAKFPLTPFITDIAESAFEEVLRNHPVSSYFKLWQMLIPRHYKLIVSLSGITYKSKKLDYLLYFSLVYALTEERI